MWNVWLSTFENQRFGSTPAYSFICLSACCVLRTGVTAGIPYSIIVPITKPGFHSSSVAKHEYPLLNQQHLSLTAQGGNWGQQEQCCRKHHVAAAAGHSSTTAGSSPLVKADGIGHKTCFSDREALHQLNWTKLKNMGSISIQLPSGTTLPFDITYCVPLCN